MSIASRARQVSSTIARAVQSLVLTGKHQAMADSPILRDTAWPPESHRPRTARTEDQYQHAARENFNTNASADRDAADIKYSTLLAQELGRQRAENTSILLSLQAEKNQAEAMCGFLENVKATARRIIHEDEAVVQRAYPGSHSCFFMHLLPALTSWIVRTGGDGAVNNHVLHVLVSRMEREAGKAEKMSAKLQTFVAERLAVRRFEPAFHAWKSVAASSKIYKHLLRWSLSKRKRTTLRSLFCEWRSTAEEEKHLRGTRRKAEVRLRSSKLQRAFRGWVTERGSAHGARELLGGLKSKLVALQSEGISLNQVSAVTSKEPPRSPNSLDHPQCRI